MKKLFSTICLISIFFVAIGSFASCNKSAHCPAYKNLNAKTDKDGVPKNKKGKSSLFPKGM